MLFFLFYCNIPLKTTQELLKTFVRRVFSVSSSYEIDLDDDLRFLAEIRKRCSFGGVYLGESSVHSPYACIFLMENKVDIREGDNVPLELQV
jgi:hypothetical protein